MQFKKSIAIIFSAFMCDVGCSVTNSADAQKLLMQEIKLDSVYYAINSNAYSSCVFGKNFFDQNFSRDPDSKPLSIYLSGEKVSVGRIANKTRWLVLRDYVLVKLANLYENPSLSPFFIDINSERFVFDIYVGQRSVKYLIFNTYSLARRGDSKPAITKDNVLSQEFIDASNNSKIPIESGILKSPDGYAQINLNEIKDKLVEIANDPKNSALVVEKKVEYSVGFLPTYHYIYRFVISWGKYTDANGNEVRAFFVSTSFVLTDSTVTEKPAHTESPTNITSSYRYDPDDAEIKYNYERAE